MSVFYRLGDRVVIDLVDEGKSAHGEVIALAGNVYEVRLDSGDLAVIIGDEPPSRAER